MPLFQLSSLAAAAPEELLAHDAGEIVVKTTHIFYLYNSIYQNFVISL